MAEYSEIVKEIKSSKYSPVYFLQGEEPFFIDNIIGHIEIDSLDEAQKSFNQYILYGKETNFAQILGTARKYPMMGDRQVVIVKEAQEIGGWNNQDNQTMLANYVENPLPSTILVFGYKYKSLDKRTKIAKTLAAHSVFMNSKKIYDNQVPQWIQNYAKARRVSLTNKAVMLLSENIGNNLQRLSNEIEKLLLSVDAGQEINELAIHRYVGISKEYNVFELQKALSSGSFGKALKIINYFNSNPTKHPLVLTVGTLFSYFSKILLVHDAPNMDKNAIAKLIGVHPYFAEEYLSAAKLYPLEQVKRNIQLVHELDLKSKGIGYNISKEKTSGLLKELIFQLMH